MVAFNYKSQWAQLVTDSIKRQTVRAGLRAAPGTMLQHYAGMRTKACRKLRTDTECVAVLDMWRAFGEEFKVCDLPGYSVVDRYFEPWGDTPRMCSRGDQNVLCLKIADLSLSLLDGFGEDVTALLDFFPPGFSGWLYRWDVPVQHEGAKRWFYVYTATNVANNGAWIAPSGRRYVTRDVATGAQAGESRAVGLMRGIPADWVVFMY